MEQTKIPNDVNHVETRADLFSLRSQAISFGLAEANVAELIQKKTYNGNSMQQQIYIYIYTYILLQYITILHISYISECC